ncbi:uncharacterized protein BO96DRAFT_327131 [Aspergillus niger CBS 101883]|uniref:Uncharacterized protein n=2 Tax=Aspergillus niger TaxID=5061 RepID=A2R7W4_ASPNC|nr:uncharacterized protein BO96DRAFT_327131 [Aspergillus niger CBS 101883]XP_059606539.1 hypothetical protein An16g04980 [Aspergillus niger]PYH61464.1 hypothetical protein BO96DRAFT_327131 [Aspergillus niger CBS 101883]CAK97352.1 hypothetical protein An16g04980 [Aspergillus niger]
MVKWLLGVDLLSTGYPQLLSLESEDGTIDEQRKAFGWAGGVFRRVETLRKPVLDWWKRIGAARIVAPGQLGKTGTGYQVRKLVIVPHDLTLADSPGGERPGRSFGGILESQRSRVQTERGKEGKRAPHTGALIGPPKCKVGSPIGTLSRSAARSPFWLVLGLQRKSAALTHRRFPHLFFTSSFPVPSPSSLAISSLTLNSLPRIQNKGPPGQFISL